MQLARDELIRAYRTMRTIRTFEDRCNQEIGTGDIPGSVHLYAGEEASGVGVCMHLSDKDTIASTHRGHGHCIAKGCDVEGMMAEIYGKATGTCKGKGGSMHIADLSKGMLGANGIVGGGPPLICGAALTAKTLKTGAVAVCFMGDGAFNQGTTAESLNLAKVWNLPAIFVVENNGFGEATKTEFATAGDITARAAAYGMPAVEVDGTDFFAVHQAAGEADRACACRRGAGRAAHEGAALLRAFLRRCRDLSDAGGKRADQTRGGLPQILPQARDRGRPARGLPARRRRQGGRRSDRTSRSRLRAPRRSPTRKRSQRTFTSATPDAPLFAKAQESERDRHAAEINPPGAERSPEARDAPRSARRHHGRGRDRRRRHRCRRCLGRRLRRHEGHPRRVRPRAHPRHADYRERLRRRGGGCGGNGACVPSPRSCSSTFSASASTSSSTRRRSSATCSAAGP